MEYNGRKIGFRRTVGSAAEISKLAPNGDISRIGEVFEGKDLSHTAENGAQLLAILNKWYEKSLVFENKDYVPDPLPADWFLSLDVDEFTEILNEAMDQMLKDDKPTIEAVELKGKKNE